MFVRANFVDIYSQGMRDRSMRSETELAREIKLTDWSMAGNLSNRSSGVQIPRDICTRLKRYLYFAKCSWIINSSYKSYFYSGAKMYYRMFHPYLHPLALNHHSYRSYRSNAMLLFCSLTIQFGPATGLRVSFWCGFWKRSNSCRSLNSHLFHIKREN